MLKPSLLDVLFDAGVAHLKPAGGGGFGVRIALDFNNGIVGAHIHDFRPEDSFAEGTWRTLAAEDMPLVAAAPPLVGLDATLLGFAATYFLQNPKYLEAPYGE